MSTSGRLSQKEIRTGSILVTVIETAKVVTFSSALPSSNYRIVFQTEANLSSVLWATAKTSSGFTLNLSIGVAGSITYVAIED